MPVYQISLRKLTPWRKQDETVHDSIWNSFPVCTCMNRLVPLMETALNLHTAMNSSMVWNGMKYVILVHTSMYWYILVCTCVIVVCTSIWISILVYSIQVNIGIYIDTLVCKWRSHSDSAMRDLVVARQNAPDLKWSVVYTCMYWYILVCTDIY